MGHPVPVKAIRAEVLLPCTALDIRMQLQNMEQTCSAQMITLAMCSDFSCHPALNPEQMV